MTCCNFRPPGGLLAEICCSLIAVVYCGVRLDDLGHLLPDVGGTLVLLAIPLSVLGTVGVSMPSLGFEQLVLLHLAH